MVKSIVERKVLLVLNYIYRISCILAKELAFKINVHIIDRDELYKKIRKQQPEG